MMEPMIVTNYEPFVEQLKLIDYKCYDYPWLDEGWLAAKDYKWQIVVSDVVALGYCCYRKHDNSFFVSKLCVKPVYQHYAIGSLLMENLILVTNGVPLWTILHEENKYLGWAAAFGWRATESKRDFFPDGRSGIIMGRE